MAILASVYANVHRGKHSKPFVAQDFMPQFDAPPRKKKQTAAEMQALLRLVTRAAGGTINGVKG